jgi:hypothetical protein
MNASLDQLWGTTIRAIDVSNDIGTIRFVIDRHASEGANEHERVELDFCSVQHLDYLRATPLPWEYSELTSIDVKSTPSGLQVVMEIWECVIRLTCTNIQVNGITVASADAA